MQTADRFREMRLEISDIYQTPCQIERPQTYGPGFVTEVVDGLQGVDAGNTSVLQSDDQVTEVLILRHAEGMLSDQDEVGLK